MFQIHEIKRWLSLRVLRTHACSLALAVSFNGTWRAPRDAFRYGPVPYLIAYTVAMATVGLPLILMQLALGQLSQQDAVGSWRAVPFFKGLGYVKLLVSFLTAIYTVVYLAVTLSFFFYMSTNALQDDTRCADFDDTSGLRNAADCYTEPYLLTVNEDPEFYISVAVLAIAFWMLFPLMLYNPVKFMKRTFYLLTPIVLILSVVVAACVGQRSAFIYFVQKDDWINYLQPYIWHGAFTQALVSSQITGGFIISAGYSIYANSNVLCSDDEIHENPMELLKSMISKTT